MQSKSCEPARCRWAARTVATLATLALAVLRAAASAQEPAASIVLGDPNDEQGLVHVEQPDGRTTAVTVDGRSARATAPGDDPSWGRYMYFRVDDSIAFDGSFAACLQVEYFDAGSGGFALQYDSTGSAFAPGGQVQRTGSQTWKTASFELLGDARFANRQNGGSDFRVGAFCTLRGDRRDPTEAQAATARCWRPISRPATTGRRGCESAAAPAWSGSRPTTRIRTPSTRSLTTTRSRSRARPGSAARTT